MMEDIKWLFRKCILQMIILILIVIGFCLICSKDLKTGDSKTLEYGNTTDQYLENQNQADQNQADQNQDVFELQNKDEQQNKQSADRLKKGYDLPMTDQQREESEQDCINAMNMIHDIFKSAVDDPNYNYVITADTATVMQNELETSELPVSVKGFQLNMRNAAAMEEFLNNSNTGETGQLVTYEINLDGGVNRRQFIYDGNDMYILGSIAIWDQNCSPVITYTSLNRLEDWKYTENGWLIFDYCVPQAPDVTETVDGSVMIRVKPLPDMFRKIATQFLLKIGYQGNNLFWINWDKDNMQDIDYNGIYQFLYEIKYGQQFESEKSECQIPKDEFEQLVMEYLPVSQEQLERSAVYYPEHQTYGWKTINCSNCAPNAFQTSVPEIAEINENADGTATLTIHAVCEKAGSEAATVHQLTVKFLDNGDIRFLKNELMDSNLQNYPAYIYRLPGR